MYAMVCVRISSTGILWLCLLLSSFLNFSSESNSPCASPVTSAKAVPPLPYLPDNSYQSDVEVNIIDKSYTISAKVYYSYRANTAALKLFSNGQDTTVILNYSTNEIFSYSGGVCTVSSLLDDSVTELFGISMVNGLPHIQDIHTAFKFAGALEEVYIGNDTVRGMSVNHWRSCGNWSGGTSLVIDYYFTTNWTTASTVPSAPVRAEVTGLKLLPNGSSYHLHHIYDYFNYLPDNDFDQTTFQTPPRVVCPGRKSTKELPVLPRRMFYRTEIILPGESVITFEDTWYDESTHLFRRDYRPFVPVYPSTSTNPLTEIHDYNTGVRYVIDKLLGSCDTVALSGNLDDSMRNVTASKYNNSFVLNMKHPLQFFNLDLNYTYIGQNTVRDMNCDTYVTQVDNFTNGDFVYNQRTTITFYFLSQGWTEVGENEVGKNQAPVPVRMELLMDNIAITNIYNFLDFDPEPPSVNVFDVGKCYPEANKVTFRVTFPGPLGQIALRPLQEWSQKSLINSIGVSSLRITDVNIDYDDANIYVSATLLDKTPIAAQFTTIDGRISERRGDSIIFNTSNPFQCASFCVNNMDFICNSFDYCTDKACHLSKKHVGVGDIMIANQECVLYSRNVEGRIPERSIAEAYQLLKLKVYSHSLKIDTDGSMVFTAVDVAILFGWVNPNVKVPTIGDHLSYKVQVSIPAVEHLYDTQIWYDKDFSVARYDTHTNQASYPFYTTNPLTIIEDYNTGVRYVIDKITQRCTSSQLGQYDFGSDITFNVSSSPEWKIDMKNPLVLFHIDSSYVFVGQQTVRGMTCNVFESFIKDFKIGNLSVAAIFRYAFLDDNWFESSDGYQSGPDDQPVRLDVFTLQYALYLQYNFYDYSTDHPDLSVFDVHQCFTAAQMKPFQIVFPGKFEESLNTTSRMFLIAATFKMALASGAALMRFQRTRLDHDSSNVYISSTLVEQTNVLLYFTKITGGPVPEHVDKVMPETGSPVQCASACFNTTDFPCNSFYYCSGSNQCLLSIQNVPEATTDVHINDCDSYSRTVQDSGIPPSNFFALLKLKNNVYNNNITISIPIPGTDQMKAFTAAYVLEDYLSYQRNVQNAASLTSFQLLSPNNTMIITDSIVLGNAIDNCAALCLAEKAYLCNGFSYCFDDGRCMYGRSHPDQLNASAFQTSVLCSTYYRSYITDYTRENGLVPAFMSKWTFSSTLSAEKCAENCSKNLECRSFEFCLNAQQCLLSTDRMLTQPGNSSISNCNLYTSTYNIDFKATNAGQFIFSSVAYFKEISIQDCSMYCVNKIGNECKGYYYCRKPSACYLTSDSPGSPTVVMSSDGDMCDFYTRIYYPTGTSSTSLLPSTITTMSNKSSTNASLTKGTSGGTSINNTKSGSPRSLFVSTSTLRVKTDEASVTHSPVPTLKACTSSVELSVTQDLLSNDNASLRKGAVAGISIATFLVGIVVGVVSLHCFWKFRRSDLRRSDQNGMTINFTAHEDM